MKKRLSIISALEDPSLLGHAFPDPETWWTWRAMLRFAYNLPTTKRERRLIRSCTGLRKVKGGAPRNYDTILALCGRRSGKSRTAAAIAAYEASLAGHQERLSPGEVGVVAICSPTRRQSKVIKDYIRAIYDSPLLQGEVVGETKSGFELREGTLIEVHTGLWSSIRGLTMLCCIVDEIAYFGYTEESKVRSDLELVRAIRPALATCKGKLICVGSPFAEKGWAFKTFRNCWANPDASTLVWKAPSLVMNETLDQHLVQRDREEDPQAAASEWDAEFRSDLSSFIDRALLDRLVVKGRTELSPIRRHRYTAYADLSSGRSDESALCIVHREEDGRVVADYLKRWKIPHVPSAVIEEVCGLLRERGISSITTDAYSVGFVESCFRARGISWRRSELPASGLYLSCLPLFTSGQVELLDIDYVLQQLAGLQRRVHSSGRESVDHVRGARDDAANALCGAIHHCARSRKRVGVLVKHRDLETSPKTEGDVLRNRIALAKVISSQHRNHH